MRHTLTMLAALSAAWMLWSGHTEPLLLGYGACSVVLVTLLDRRMDRIAERHDGVAPHPIPVALGLRALLYLPWLAWEIVKTNFQVAKVILSPSLPIHSQLVRVPGTQRTAAGQVIFANSITLTPGTITLDVRGGFLLVHALTDDAAEGLADGNMDRRCTALEGGG